jgi:Phosphotransferase enzyme family
VINDVPSPGDISPAWISNLLQNQGVDIDISAVMSVPIGTGQVGATYRYMLTHSGTSPASIVGKFPSNDPLSRETGKSHLTYIRESRFYQHFAGKKPMPVPHHHFIAFDEDTHDFALIMADLPHHVAGNQLNTPSLAEAQLAMSAAATIHAAWWGDPMLDTLDWLNGTKAVPPPLDIEALYAKFWPAFCDRYAERVTPEMKRVGDAFVGELGAWGERSSGPRCLTHNDFRPDNMLFDLNDPKQPIIVVDWQTVGVGCGAGDVAYYMGTAFDPDMRKCEETALFNLYCDGLLANGVPKADTENLWDIYRTAGFSGFLMGVTASIVVQQTDRGDAMFLKMCERSAAMVIDHGDIALPR